MPSFATCRAWIVCVLLASVGSHALAAPAKPTGNVTKWMTNYDAAIIQAKKENKIVLAYFSGSDWDQWCIKLDKDVLDTDMFRAWADENAILLRVDFPKEKKLSGLVKAQNDKLKTRFSVSKSPTFLFLDTAGQPFARCGYDEAKLRETERSQEPRAWIEYCDKTVHAKPHDEVLQQQKTLTEGVAYAKKHFISLLIMVSQGHAKVPMQTKAELLKNQIFIRWVNRTMAFVSMEWPEDSDTSPDAELFRAMAAKKNVQPAPLQLLVWDMQTSKIKGQIKSIEPDKVEPLLQLIESQLPKLDYSGAWLEDYRKAMAISQQQRRYILLNFTSMDSSDWCKKMQEEILDTEAFKTFARKHLVLVRADFPKAATQPEALATQNHDLAEMFNIRGYPSLVVLNPLGQRVTEAKYNKGGPEPLLAVLDKVITDDTKRRAMLAGEDEPQ